MDKKTALQYVQLLHHSREKFTDRKMSEAFEIKEIASYFLHFSSRDFHFFGYSIFLYSLSNIPSCIYFHKNQYHWLLLFYSQRKKQKDLQVFYLFLGCIEGIVSTCSDSKIGCPSGSNSIFWLFSFWVCCRSRRKLA